MEILPFWNEKCKRISDQIPNFVKEPHRSENSTFGIDERNPLERYVNAGTIVSDVKTELLLRLGNEIIRENETEKLRAIENKDRMAKERLHKLQKIWYKGKKGVVLTEEETEYRKPLPIQKYEKPKPNSVIKVRMYPNPEQQEVLRDFFKTIRQVYNSTVELLRKQNEENKDKEEKVYLKEGELYKILISETTREYQKNTPTFLRQQAIFEVFGAQKACFTNLKKGNIRHFKLNFRNRKLLKTETFDLERKTCHLTENNELSVFPKFIKGPIPLNIRKPLPRFDYEPKIQHNIRTNKWFLIVPTYKFVEKPIENFSKVCGIDPGVCSFLTIYGMEKLTQIGNSEMANVFLPIMKRISMFQSLIDKNKRNQTRTRKLSSRTVKNMKKRMAKLRERIQNKIKDIHHRTTKLLCDNYTTIILPKFQVKRMSRTLGRRTNKEMYCWSHFKFREMITNKTRQYPQCNVVNETEEYTSKTCGHCGNVRRTLRGRTYQCSECKIVMDRDANGARNIFIKHISSLVTEEQLFL